MYLGIDIGTSSVKTVLFDRDQRLIAQLKAEGLGIFLISHDIHDVMALCDRVSVMKNGKLVGTVRVGDVTEDDILGMIILGKQPAVMVQ